MSQPQKAFILGISDLGSVLYDNIAKSPNIEIGGFAVEPRWAKKTNFMNLPVISTDDLENIFPPERYGCYVAIGYSGLNRHRQAAFEKMRARGYHLLSWQHPSAQVDVDELGEGNLFFANVLIDTRTRIGTGNIFYPASLLAHHSQIGDFNFFAVGACVAGHVRMGNCNFLGANSTVINHRELKSRCLVGAGACLTVNLEDDQVFAPARGSILQGKKGTDFL